MAGDQVRYGDDVLGAASDVERRRLTAMGAVADPTTQALLRRLALGHGWRCWEVGAGGGSVAAWIGEQVFSERPGAAPAAPPPDPGTGLHL